jgi:transcriptional regulator with XRE-family HTH domain
MDIGQALRFCRTHKDMTQQEVARRAGFDASYISAIELGRDNVPMSTVERLAEAVGVPVFLFAFLCDREKIVEIDPKLAEMMSGELFKYLRR